MITSMQSSRKAKERVLILKLTSLLKKQLVVLCEVDVSTLGAARTDTPLVREWNTGATGCL